MFRFGQVLICGAAIIAADPVTVYNLPPVPSLFEAGRLHGQHAKQQITAFQETAEIGKLLNFTHSDTGRIALEKLRNASIEATPWLEVELAGIAEGSGANLDDIWAVNLVSELEQLALPQGDHCSDIMGRDDATGEVWHGHTEDWSMDFKPLCYFVVYNTDAEASFRPIGGLVYPGQAPGFAVTFTPSLWSTSNSLFPWGINVTGKGVVAVARAALEHADPEEVARRYNCTGQAYGMNTQVVANAPGRAFAADIESAGAANSVRLEALDKNLTHFNNYKYQPDVKVKFDSSSAHRQAAADKHPAPGSRADVLSILGDTSDKEWPIYIVNHTMFATVFHSGTGRFWVWHGSNPNESEPSWTSTLAEVFKSSSLPAVV